MLWIYSFIQLIWSYSFCYMHAMAACFLKRKSSKKKVRDCLRRMYCYLFCNNLDPYIISKQAFLNKWNYQMFRKNRKNNPVWIFFKTVSFSSLFIENKVYCNSKRFYTIIWTIYIFRLQKMGGTVPPLVLLNRRGASLG